ncbi:uncharacterized protein [Dermacentor andersoni]|uniref:uncharacterized protein n=1 Tax=Dermacentor andersoni TaxID=34620 RepID=UPI003B3B8AE8
MSVRFLRSESSNKFALLGVAGCLGLLGLILFVAINSFTGEETSTDWTLNVKEPGYSTVSSSPRVSPPTQPPAASTATPGGDRTHSAEPATEEGSANTHSPIAQGEETSPDSTPYGKEPGYSTISPSSPMRPPTVSPSASTGTYPTEPATEDGSATTHPAIVKGNKEIICTVGGVVAEIKGFPPDSLCDYIFYTHVYVHPNSSEVLSSNYASTYRMFLDNMLSYAKTEGGISFNVRDTDSTLVNKAKGNLQDLKNNKIWHYGSLDVIDILDNLKPLVRVALKLLTMSSVKVLLENDTHSALISEDMMAGLSLEMGAMMYSLGRYYPGTYEDVLYETCVNSTPTYLHKGCKIGRYKLNQFYDVNIVFDNDSRWTVLLYDDAQTVTYKVQKLKRENLRKRFSWLYYDVHLGDFEAECYSTNPFHSIEALRDEFFASNP